MFFMACAPHRNLVYFSNLTEVSNTQMENIPELKLQKNDQLSMTLTSLNAEYNALFSGTNNTTVGGKAIFRINNNGMISLPLIGDLKVEGLTVEQAQNLIASELKKQIKNPVVDLQLANFKFTVIGEVNHPASLNIPGDKVNLLEALGMAGDMTVYGKRENVLVIRETNGTRQMTRLNLNDKNVFSSPFFHLKQNDIVYVEPDKSKEKEYNPNVRAVPLITTAISAVVVVLTALLIR